MEEVEGCRFLVKPILRMRQKYHVSANGIRRFAAIERNWPDQTAILKFELHCESFTGMKRKGFRQGLEKGVSLLQISQYRSILCGGLWKEVRFLSIIIFRLSDPEGQFCILK
ncbi:hypothetical protein WH297_21300 [Ochrobactrum vermis]|uniref:Transposase n=1 Tax=Ochrobactrum vermis TaxID=1827297 RepID=A0ABU8PJ31_9HYPH|nr:hypothetical protein [Ochrobactrum vermis]PQZ26522.1 hypothetical protein CQZ93_21625 [Ochrobactrum vermis]